MKVSIGPGLEDLKRLAEERIDRVYDSVRQRRALYLPKVMDAEKVLAGTSVEALEAEAKATGVPAEQLALKILANAKRDAGSEATRVGLKQRVRAAKSPEAMKRVLEPHGIGIYE